MKGKKRPLYLMVAIASCLVMAAYNYYENRAVFYAELGTEDILHREKEILVNLRLAQLLGEHGQIDEIKERLEQARINRDIDYYIATRDGRPVFWGTADGTYQSLLADYKPGVDYITKDVSFRAEMLDQNLLVMVGINKQSDVAFEKYLHHYRKVFIEQAFALGFLGFAIFFYYSRDLLLLVGLFRGKDRKLFGRIKTKSRESEILAQGLIGYEASMDLLKTKSERLERQVLPSLKKEVLSGKTPPYDFDCTLVRTDINNFSTIYNTHDVTTFMAIINAFFGEVSEIVARHRGLVHEFVGDEVIFYIKDEERENSFMAAMATIFEINVIAHRYSIETMRVHGYPFTVKSSLAHGKIRFGPLVNGFAVAGSVLIETVRILSHIVEKDGNVVYFDSVHLARLTGLFETRETMSVQLKGFNGLRKLVATTAQKTLPEVLEKLTPSSVANLAYFRTNEAVLEILTYLETKAVVSQDLNDLAFKNQFDLQLAILKTLREFPMGVSTRDGASTSVLQSRLGSLLRAIQDQLRTRRPKPAAVLLSNVLMLAQSLFPAGALDGSLESQIKTYLADSDPRVVASALETLTFFRSHVEPEIYRHFLQSADNRIVANAMVQEGMLGLSSTVIRQLRQMMASPHTADCASAIFVLGELARYHRSRDLVYYSTHVEFKDLISKLPTYAVHVDKKVRRQALVAAKKAAESETIELILKKIDSSADSALVAEAHQVFESAFILPATASKKSA